MPTITSPQVEISAAQEAKKSSFLEDLKRRSFNATAAAEARQVASANRAEFNVSAFRAFVQSNSALASLRDVCDDED